MHRILDANVANASQVTDESKRQAGSGLAIDKLHPAVLPRNTVLFRVGHETVKKMRVPESDNYSSPWWMLECDFLKILHMGQRDTAWAGRVGLAIAAEWGGDCQLQVRVVLSKPLYAWSGQGLPISAGRSARAVAADDPRAYWFPELSITQLFIPGLKLIPRGHARGLWDTVFQTRSQEKWLWSGNQLNLDTKKPFVDREALLPGLRPGRVKPAQSGKK